MGDVWRWKVEESTPAGTNARSVGSRSNLVAFYSVHHLNQQQCWTWKRCIYNVSLLYAHQTNVN
jgi:hypothetical protein